MALRLKHVLGLGVALTLVAACERPSAVADQQTRRDAAPRGLVETRPPPTDAGAEAQTARLDGRPIWASSRRGDAEANAQRAFERNGAAFDARTRDEFVRKAHAFVHNPPPGVERLTRSNGDVLLYDARTNVFAVANRDGAPRTMFKPDDGAAYWRTQKDREARRQTAGAAGRDRGEADG